MASIEALFQGQRDARWAVAASGPDQRRARLGRLLEALVARRAEAHAALRADFRKVPEEVDLAELYPLIAELKGAMRQPGALDAPGHGCPRRSASPAAGPGSGHEPKGVVLVISPWNYPLYLTLGPAGVRRRRGQLRGAQALGVHPARRAPS